MANKGEGVAIGVLAIVVIALFYLAVVGQFVISYHVYFNFWDRVVFGIVAFVIIFLLVFFARD